MNAIVATQDRSGTPGSDRLLRLAVRLDAWVSGVFGLAVLVGGEFLGDLLGAPSTFLEAVGGVCLVYAGVLWIVQTRPVVSGAAGWTLVVANIMWVAASVLLVVFGWFALTPMGVGFVLLQAIVVGGLAELQFVGVRRTG